MKLNKIAIISVLFLFLLSSGSALQDNWNQGTYTSCDYTEWSNDWINEGFNQKLVSSCETLYVGGNNIGTGIIYTNESDNYKAINISIDYDDLNDATYDYAISVYGDTNYKSGTSTYLNDSMTLFVNNIGNINSTVELLVNDSQVDNITNVNSNNLGDISVYPEKDSIYIGGNKAFNYSNWSNINLSSKGISLGYGNNNNDHAIKTVNVTYINGTYETINETNVTNSTRDSIIVAIPMPKVFEELGMPYGTPFLVNLVVIILSLILILIPQPVVDSFKFITTSVTDIIGLAIETATIGAKWLIYIREVGIERLKQLLVLGLMFIGFKYAQQIRDAVNGNRDIASVIAEIYDDILDKLSTLERITYRALDTVSNIASIFVLTFNMLVNIYHKIRDSIPFV